MKSSQSFSHASWLALIWMGAFFFIPAVLILGYSFATRGAYGFVVWSWTWDNYLRLFSSTYLKIFWNTLQFSFFSSLFCLVLAVPTVWALFSIRPKVRSLVLYLICLPFLVNLVIRIYSLRLLFGYDGPVATSLTFLQIPFDPMQLSQSSFLVLLGMITTYLPFVVLPLYSTFSQFNFQLVEAHLDLGGSPWSSFWKVIWPANREGFIRAFFLMFIPCFGEYVIPDLLGGAKVLLFGNLVTEQFLKLRNWPFGSALVITFVLLMLFLQLSVLRVLVRRRTR